LTACYAAGAAGAPRAPGAPRTLQPDDIDLATEEAAEAARLSTLLPQLQDAAVREGSSSSRKGGVKREGDEPEV